MTAGVVRFSSALVAFCLLAVAFCARQLSAGLSLLLFNDGSSGVTGRGEMNDDDALLFLRSSSGDIAANNNNTIYYSVRRPVKPIEPFVTVSQSANNTTSPSASSSSFTRTGRRQEEQRPNDNTTSSSSFLTRRQERRARMFRCDCTYWKCRRCQRAILVVHKMGFLMTNHLLEQQQKQNQYFPTKVKLGEISSFLGRDGRVGPGQIFNTYYRDPLEPRTITGSRRRRSSTSPYTDYRHVLVTRNLYQALLSGYLYHRSGNECWNDNAGNAWNFSSSSSTEEWTPWLNEEDWQERIWQGRRRDNDDNNDSDDKSLFFRRRQRRALPSSSSFPAARNRTLCQYLVEESEETGLSAYVEWAWYMYLRPLLELHRERLRREEVVANAASDGGGGGGNNNSHGGDDRHQRTGKTLRVCYEDLASSNASSVDRVMREINDWFYPDLEMPYRRPDLGRAAGHATTKDRAQVNRLLGLLRAVDDEQYHGDIDAANRELGCGL